MGETAATLDQLGLKFGTDKSSAEHDYLNFYERYFGPLRYKPVRLLEVGILGGASLSVWEQYFVDGVIVGADIDLSTKRFERGRVLVEIVDQANIEHLTRIGVQHGPFDIVIEDGSHMWEHQITTLKALFPFVKCNGIYIVEDLQTNFESMAGEYRGGAGMSCVEYIKRLVDLHVGDEQLDVVKENDAFLRTYGQAMKSISFYRHACLIEKFYAEAFMPFSDEPFISGGPTPALPVALLAHFGGQGDTVGQSGWVRARRRAQGIQGFALDTENIVAGAIRYRARSTATGWGEWVACPGYAGTRGRSDNLVGFSIKLMDGARDAFELVVIGQFAGSSELVEAGPHGDCVSPGGCHVLTGMQVLVRPKLHGS